MRQQQEERRVSTNPANRRSSERAYSEPATGERWCVREAAPSTLPGHEGARCLIFASDMILRRVWTYPADWRRLSPAELVALSWGT